MKQIFSIMALAAASLSLSAQETTTWGYYTDNNFSDLTGVGSSSYNAFYAGQLVPCDGLTQGATIEAINVPVANSAKFKSLLVWIADSEWNVISIQDVDLKTVTAKAYNTITLDSPYTIEEDIYVGYAFSYKPLAIKTNEDNYPVYCDGNKTEYGANACLVALANNTSKFPAGGSFYDYTENFGSLGMNIELSGVTLSDYCVSCGAFPSKTTQVNTTKAHKIALSSNGSVEVENIEYVLTVDGVSETRTADVSIKAGLNKTATISVEFTSPAEEGVYEVSMAITKVNGEENSLSEPVVTEFNNVTFLPVRRTVVEEFTGTGCGWCPRGLAGMDLLKETYPDTFIGIGLHQYNSSDPMYPVNGYKSLGFSGAPSCSIDRKSGTGVDPFYGEGSTKRGILDAFDKYNAMTTDVAVELTAVWNESNSSNVDLTANIMSLAQNDYKVAFVLTADALTGTTSEWRQANYYASNYTYGQQGDELLDQFCSGGTYGTQYFFWDFNDALIASSYESLYSNKETAVSFSANETKQVSFTLALPTSESLLTAVKNSIDKVYGVVIITNAKGEIVNAARANVVASTTAIDNVKAETAAPAARYSIDGKPMTEGQKGLSIIRNANGSVQKQLAR